VSRVIERPVFGQGRHLAELKVMPELGGLGAHPSISWLSP
jgi:hypothetical protein